MSSSYSIRNGDGRLGVDSWDNRRYNHSSSSNRWDPTQYAFNPLMGGYPSMGGYSGQIDYSAFLANVANKRAQYDQNSNNFIANNTRFTAAQEQQVAPARKTLDGVDDGSIGFGGATKNFFKGIGNFFKGMICDENGFSIKRTLVTVGITAAAVGICVATGGAAAPILVGIGAALSGAEIAKGAIGAATAKTDAQAEQAWQEIGSGTTGVTLSVLGAKGGLKSAGKMPPGEVSALKATGECLKITGKGIKSGVKAILTHPIKSGSAVIEYGKTARANLTEAFSPVAVKGNVIKAEQHKICTELDRANSRLARAQAAESESAPAPTSATATAPESASVPPKPTVSKEVGEAQAEIEELGAATRRLKKAETYEPTPKGIKALKANIAQLEEQVKIEPTESNSYAIAQAKTKLARAQGDYELSKRLHKPSQISRLAKECQAEIDTRKGKLVKADATEKPILEAEIKEYNARLNTLIGAARKYNLRAVWDLNGSQWRAGLVLANETHE